MNDYNPTNTAASECPDVDKSWNAVATPLPPVVNAQACNCMMDTLSCAVAEDVDEEDYGGVFGFICGEADGKYCDGINRNTTKDKSYGAYSMCSASQQLSFAMNAYADAVPNGCDFEGKAKTKSAASETPSACKALLDQAGAEGTGTLNAPANNGNGGQQSSKAAAAGLPVPHFNAAFVGLGVYVLAAVFSGMALILF
jgi:hypothetical protein